MLVSGHIKIYCEDGHGTCIKIYLPRAAGDDIKSIGAAMTVPVQGGTEAILVVEDDPLVAELRDHPAGGARLSCDLGRQRRLGAGADRPGEHV